MSKGTEAGSLGRGIWMVKRMSRLQAEVTGLAEVGSSRDWKEGEWKMS